MGKRVWYAALGVVLVVMIIGVRSAARNPVRDVRVEYNDGDLTEFQTVTQRADINTLSVGRLKREPRSADGTWHKLTAAGSVYRLGTKAPVRSLVIERTDDILFLSAVITRGGKRIPM